MQNTARSSARMSVRPIWGSIMRWLQRRFDFDSKAVRLLSKGHQGHRDVSRCSYADLIYLFIIYLRLSVAAERSQHGPNAVEWVERRSNRSRIVVCNQRLNSEGKAVEILTLVEILPYAQAEGSKVNK